jgi:hypothetical protein
MKEETQMAITFNRDHLSPVTITSAINAEHLIEDDYTNWYRMHSWDAEGKMAFYIPDSSIGARILLTQDQLDAILTGNTHGEIILTAKEEAAQQHREAQMPACRALVADMFSRSADRKQITVDEACEILFDLYMNSDTEVPDTMHAELFAELWNELATTTEEKEEQTMTMYVTVFTHKGAQVARIQPDGNSLYEYFTGYDFMGSADWTTDASEAKLMSLEEAEQIAQDLTDGEPEEEEQTMKYIVANEDGCKTVLKTNSIVEALKARDAFDEENPWLCPTGIFDEENRAVDPDRDWDTFVMDIIDELSGMECICGVASLSLEGAQHQLDDWKASGIRVPEGLTAEILQYLWNSWLTQYVAAYAEAQQSNDDASYQETVREAASFEAIDVDDLDDILREDDQPEETFEVDPDEYFPPQEDPLMKQLQLALDAAVADRDETGNRWKALTEEPGATELECHRAYTRYEHSQGYLEGLTNGIFAAGYNIRTDVDTTKMTVTK